MSPAATPYLGAEAAAQGDRELASPWVRRPVPVTYPPHVIAELKHATKLFQSIERAVAAEIAGLEAAGVELDRSVSSGVSFGLVGLAVLAHIAVLKSHEARP